MANSLKQRIESENEGFATENKNMVCKTCKFSGKLYSGKKVTDYTAGSCEKYDVKPSSVYFNGEKCPRYIEK